MDGAHLLATLDADLSLRFKVGYDRAAALPGDIEPAPLGDEKYRQLDFFIADIADPSPKCDMASMEHPVFALRAGDRRIRRYQHRGNVMEIQPGAKGMATIHDKDVLIYCAGQLVEAMNCGRDINRKIRFTAHDFLLKTNRGVIDPARITIYAAYRTRGSWKYDLTRSGVFWINVMCAVAAALSLALVRAATLLPTACFKSALRRSSGLSSGL